MALGLEKTGVGAQAMALGVDRGHGNARSVQARRRRNDFPAENRGHPKLDDAGTRTSFEVDDVDGDR